MTRHGNGGDCCAGIEKLTPLPTANRPGLDTLKYRVGTHSTFLETMQARLTDLYLEIEDGAKKRVYPLRSLTTREAADPAIALLDAWAMVADVLTFYQERLANEGYLRTAAERRSVLELARLVGYRLRPGVAASVYLAFTLEEDHQVEIPAGTRAQSLPGPGELPQPFETSLPLEARADWNELQPRLTRPQLITAATDILYFKGTATNLQPNAPLLIDLGASQEFRLVKIVEPDPANDRTKVTLQTKGAISPAAEPAAGLAAAAMPENLGSKPLRAFARSLANVGQLSTDQMQQLIEQFAAALLADFVALAGMPPSASRKQAIQETIAALNAIKKAIAQITGGVSSVSLLADRLNRINAWADQALAVLAPLAGPGMDQGTVPPPQVTNLGGLVSELLKPLPLETIPPRSSLHLRRDIRTSFAPGSDLGTQLLTSLQPVLRPLLYTAWGNMVVTEPSEVKVYALRATASLFGHNVPREPRYETAPSPNADDEPLITPAAVGDLLPPSQWLDWPLESDERGDRLFLDTAYKGIMQDSYIVVESPVDDKLEEFQILPFQVAQVVTRSRNAYGLGAKTTVITLPAGQTWWEPEAGSRDQFTTFVRGTTVYAESEELALAEAPIDPVEEPVSGDRIELAGLYDGLESGRWLIVSGERVDLKDLTGAPIPGLTGAELVMLAGVEQGSDPTLPGDTTHSTLLLENDLAYSYKLDTVVIYGNVVKATHGETREEVLGSGDGSQARQEFPLKQSPLTFLATPTPAGAESTLEVRVNDILWHEADNLFELGPIDRGYITQTDNEDKTTVMFGDGVHGARLPSGRENVEAIYRKGIGKPGNVVANQISLLATRPLGVKGVINPLPASGGADRESRDQARRNVPLAVMALDRLVSVQDYADFTRTFAGIGKASAVELSDGQRQVVHLTIAGAEDIPIDKTSDLYQNLRQALHQFGDPYQPIQVDVRELRLLLISANVRLLPDYLWESVEPMIRQALLDTFSFERRELGQDVVQGEVISAIQRVPGVAYSDLDVLDSVHEGITPEDLDGLAETLAGPDQPKKRVRARMAWVDPDATDPDERLKPAQIVYLSPDVPDTLILRYIS